MQQDALESKLQASSITYLLNYENQVIPNRSQMEVLPDWSLSPLAESKIRQLGFFPMTDGASFTLFR